MNAAIREERVADVASVHAVNVAAFETDAEARLVDTLRKVADPVISLVAEVDGTVVGHILFTPVSAETAVDMRLMGLAPMAVLPAYQRRGIGSALVRAGLEACRERGVGAVVVLGHPTYYPRFGFVNSSRFGLESEYDVPRGAFMALELIPGALEAVSGTVRYHEAFGEV